MILAVSDTTRYIVVPLLAAALAACIAVTGIVAPLILFRKQELARVQIQALTADSTALKRAIEQLRNNVYLLREVTQRFGLESSLTHEQGQVVESARDRMFHILYSDQRLFDSIVPKALGSRKRMQKLMLTLGELESRLGGAFTPAKATDPVMLFGIYTLCYLLAVDDQEKNEDFEVLKFLEKNNSEAAPLFDALFKE